MAVHASPAIVGRDHIAMATNTIVIDARVNAKVAGGVAQWVIGMAGALSGLADGSEEYVFMVHEDAHDWLDPYVSGPACVKAVPQSVVSRLGAHFPVLRPAWRRTRDVLRRHVGVRKPYDRLLTDLGARVVHFSTQQGFETSVPTIYQPHDLQHLHLPDLFSGDDWRHREDTYRRFCARADLIIVASAWTKRDLVAQYGLPSAKIAVVPVPPVVRFYPPVSAAQTVRLLAKMSVPKQFLYYPAQTFRHKNHTRLLDALANAARAGVVANLVCSGRQTEEYVAIRRKVSELGLDSQVSFVGYVSELEVQALYSAARALLFPSLFEGWGLPIFEAFAHGLPVACSNVTNLPEMAGDAAITFDPYDRDEMSRAIVALWTDRGLCQRLGAAGQARIAELDWGKTGQLVRACYRKVAGSPLTRTDRELLAEALST